jgi:hypothetical protein
MFAASATPAVRADVAATARIVAEIREMDCMVDSSLGPRDGRSCRRPTNPRSAEELRACDVD